MALMTWGEFKAAREAAGVTDEHEIWHIDVAYPTQEDLEIVIEPDGTITVH